MDAWDDTPEGAIAQVWRQVVSEETVAAAAKPDFRTWGDDE